MLQPVNLHACYCNLLSVPSKATIAKLPINYWFTGGIDKPGVALLPMGDLLNHDPGRHVAWHTGPTGLDAFHFITHTPVEQASSVLMLLFFLSQSLHSAVLGHFTKQFLQWM